jgi:hypothetical protein
VTHKITVYMGPGVQGSERASFTADWSWSEYGPEEALRRIGLEYKQADYFPTRQVVIVIDPVQVDPEQVEKLKGQIRQAAELLEETGLL